MSSSGLKAARMASDIAIGLSVFGAMSSALTILASAACIMIFSAPVVASSVFLAAFWGGVFGLLSSVGIGVVSYGSNALINKKIESKGENYTKSTESTKKSAPVYGGL